jgi:uncharacterized membrane protein
MDTRVGAITRGGSIPKILKDAALAVGALVLLRPKGTLVHKRRGRICALAVLVSCVIALGIYRLGVFFFAHWLAVAEPIAISVGFAAAYFKRPRTGWMHLHLTCMLASFHILVGGGVNEVFLRVKVLRQLAPNLNSPAVGMTHLAVMVTLPA